ncbi:MAG TPA: HD domain-containing protein [Vicinamibacterales bacterium]|nr:HD domain-containing protein [Vicinamibacterales bacterium]
MHTPPPLAIDIAHEVRARGGRALIVGGWVRDRMLGREAKDLDLEVFGVAADALKTTLEAFGQVNSVGESFTVYKVGDVDVSLPRRESKSGRGHKGFVVEGDPDLSFLEAARRRDFTINAMSVDPLTNELIDPFDGATDLARRILRAVDHTTFADDSLRVLRALQFAARFDLTVDEGTKALCRRLPLDDLPAERVWGEVEKLLLRADRPSVGLALAMELGVVHKLWPELLALSGCEQEFEWHPEGDVWVHTLMVADEARKRIEGLDHPRAVVMMLSALCHDMGKPLTTRFEDGRIRSKGHEEAGVGPATAFLDRLNIHSIGGYDVRHTVLGIVAHHLKPSMFFKSPTPVSDGAFRRLAQKVDPELLARFARADCHGRTGTFDCNAMDWFLERARALGVEHLPPAPLLMGRHVLEFGIAPGPAVGVLLKAVYEKQLDGEITTIEEALGALKALLDGRTSA